MKIAHVLPSLARGGGERLTIELANRQVDAGHDVTLVVGSFLPADLTHGGLDPRVTTTFITSDVGRTRYRAMLPWIWSRREWLASRDILHCHLTYGGFFGAFFRRLRGRRPRPAIVETYHAVGMPIARRLKWLHRRLASGLDGLALMVEDRSWREFASRHGDMVYRIIPAGIEMPEPVLNGERNAYRANLGIAEKALVVSTIGRLVSERRARSYIPVFARIAEEISRDVHFLMGGDGAEREAIESDAATAGIRERLHLPGSITDIKLPFAISDLYVTANVGAVPGVAGLQAVAAGVPTIAFQLSPDYPGGLDDWIWSSRNLDRVATKAVELLQDPAASRELALHQLAHLKARHSASAMAEAYEVFYRDALASIRSE
jgi:glycosyltransferase involved in cell wall biosynthesis